MEVNAARFSENADETQAAAADATLGAQKSEDHKKLIEYGIHELVADRLDEIYNSGKNANIRDIYNFSSVSIAAVITTVNFFFCTRVHTPRSQCLTTIIACYLVSYV